MPEVESSTIILNNLVPPGGVEIGTKEIHGHVLDIVSVTGRALPDDDIMGLK